MCKITKYWFSFSLLHQLEFIKRIITSHFFYLVQNRKEKLDLFLLISFYQLDSIALLRCSFSALKTSFVETNVFFFNVYLCTGIKLYVICACMNIYGGEVMTACLATVCTTDLQ